MNNLSVNFLVFAPHAMDSDPPHYSQPPLYPDTPTSHHNTSSNLFVQGICRVPVNHAVEHRTSYTFPALHPFTVSTISSLTSLQTLPPYSEAVTHELTTN
ncbi:unnamed protein product [Cyberlindnera jadinii]|uniref:Uncharacterized protein n=1 Tax=Cyberlindnera jadinii (strain ATCC 18201 / CBS 1600 / BCRC 20928 / JCM 3617 / NBRC 0987 / NRRL Y-1542) TaxID=983966 RepID=A0A0H5C6U0_CYBJN|nr:unnamed protein product [Cyberlindnera jadinii]